MSGNSYGNSRKKRKPRKPKQGTTNPLHRKQNLRRRHQLEEEDQ